MGAFNALFRCPGKPNRTYWLVVGASSRASNAADSQGKGSFRMFESTLGHFTNHFFADRAIAFQRTGFDTQHVFLRLIGIGDKPAIEPLRTSRYFGDRLRYPS